MSATSSWVSDASSSAPAPVLIKAHPSKTLTARGKVTGISATIKLTPQKFLRPLSTPIYIKALAALPTATLGYFSG